MINIIFDMIYYYLTDKLQIFVKISQIIHQLILGYEKLNYLRLYNQKDFLVGFLVNY